MLAKGVLGSHWLLLFNMWCGHYMFMFTYAEKTLPVPKYIIGNIYQRLHFFKTFDENYMIDFGIITNLS